MKKSLFLIDGVHSSANSISAVKELCGRYSAEPDVFLWIGGTEKMKNREIFSGDFEHEFGIPVTFPETGDEPDPAKDIAKVLYENPGVKTVIQLSGAPQIDRIRTSEYAAAAVFSGAEYIAGSTVFQVYRVDTKHNKPSLGIYATNKRVGKTAFGSYIGNLFCGITGYDTKWKPVLLTHSRGGPDEPPLIDIYRKSAARPAEDLTKAELLTSRFKPEYLGRLLDFGLHGASDVFEDALIISAYLDAWEKNGSEAPYISLIGCRRAGAGYFNEFAVSNVAAGVSRANLTPANIIVHEGSGAEHPPVDVDAVVFLIPSDADPRLLEDFPGVDRAPLFIFANCQEETALPENAESISDIIRRRSPDAQIRFTRFEPEIIGHSAGDFEGKSAAFFTTAPGYILEKLAALLEKRYRCRIAATFNNLDNDAEMKKSIDSVHLDCDIMFFEIKARGVEGALYAEKKYSLPYRYVNNIPVEVDSSFEPLGDNVGLDEAVLNTARFAEEAFSVRREAAPLRR